MPRRSALDCKIQWLQQDHPSLSFSKWTNPSLQRLYAIVESYQSSPSGSQGHWQSIADELADHPDEEGTRRTAAECLRMWRKRGGQKKDWSEEQDETLRQAVARFGENWQSGGSLLASLPSFLADFLPFALLALPLYARSTHSRPPRRSFLGPMPQPLPQIPRPNNQARPVVHRRGRLSPRCSRRRRVTQLDYYLQARGREDGRPVQGEMGE